MHDERPVAELIRVAAAVVIGVGKLHSLVDAVTPLALLVRVITI
jgi:hypothetical protein